MCLPFFFFCTSSFTVRCVVWPHRSAGVTQEDTYKKKEFFGLNLPFAVLATTFLAEEAREVGGFPVYLHSAALATLLLVRKVRPYFPFPRRSQCCAKKSPSTTLHVSAYCENGPSQLVPCDFPDVRTHVPNNRGLRNDSAMSTTTNWK